MKSPAERLKPYSHARAYQKGESIFFQGEAPHYGVMITRGFVRSYSITTSGEERTIAFFAEGDILPLSWLLGTTAHSLFYYQAVSDIQTLQFTKDDFQSHVLDDKDALLSLFHTLGRDHTAAMLRINGLEQSHAEDKVAFTLYYLAFRYGKQLPGDAMHTIEMTLRHATIAGLVGLSRERTTKILVHLHKLGIISYKNGIYRVYKDRLENRIGEGVFHDVQL